MINFAKISKIPPKKRMAAALRGFGFCEAPSMAQHLRGLGLLSLAGPVPEGVERDSEDKRQDTRAAEEEQRRQAEERAGDRKRQQRQVEEQRQADEQQRLIDQSRREDDDRKKRQRKLELAQQHDKETLLKAAGEPQDEGARQDDEARRVRDALLAEEADRVREALRIEKLRLAKEELRAKEAGAPPTTFPTGEEGPPPGEEGPPPGEEAPPKSGPPDRYATGTEDGFVPPAAVEEGDSGGGGYSDSRPAVAQTIQAVQSNGGWVDKVKALPMPVKVIGGIAVAYIVWKVLE